MAEERNNETLAAAEELSEQRRIRRGKLDALRAAGQDPFLITRFERTANSKEVKENEQLMDAEVIVAGRIMSRRIMGKASFCHIQDEEGVLQLYLRRDDIGVESYQGFKAMDIGDIVGVKGKVFVTKSGEVSVHADELTLLSKSLIPLPEKFHGLKDTDLRYRQRYVDLIMNPDSRRVFRMRSDIIRSMREYLDSRRFMEVETPILQTSAGGAAARPFITHHNTLDIDMYLRIATELHLKRLIVGGFDRVYEIGRIFRNEGMDTRHNPEFTTVELYAAYMDVVDIMNLTEDMIRYIALKVLPEAIVEFEGEKIRMDLPFKRATMAELVKEKTGIDFTVLSDAEAYEAAKAAGFAELKEGMTRGQLLYEGFDQFVEKTLIQPTFVLDHPVEVSPLAKRKPDEPWLTDRFELFVCGSELANAFSELNDPIDQYNRFLDQAKQREKGDDEAHVMDDDFVMALEYGMPPTGGLGIGIDRLVMLLSGCYNIRDVLLFPTMKPMGAAAKKEEKEVEPVAEQAVEAVKEVIDFTGVEVEPLFADAVDFETFSKSDFRAVKVKACEAVKKSKKLLKFTLDDGTGTDRTILSGIHAYYEPEELIGKTLIAITNLPPRAMMGIESCGMLLSALHTVEGEEKLNLLMVDDHIPAGAKLY
ncbi:MAG: lysine--tRNA ligase [Clostridiales bacterium]|nr:lysine--tRNA ligase [Clostridiales bacterium]